MKLSSSLCLLITLLTFGPFSANAKSNLKGFVGNIDKLTTENSNFRSIIYTAKHIQLSLMSIKPGEDIGEEVHPDIDQFFRVEAGSGTVMINDRKTSINEGDAVIVPAGSRHNITNTGDKPLKLYSLYAPPRHKDGTVHKTKKAATSSEEKFDGKVSE